MYYTPIPTDMQKAFYELVDKQKPFDERDIKRITIPVDADAEATFRGLKIANQLKEDAIKRGILTYSYKFRLYFPTKLKLNNG